MEKKLMIYKIFFSFLKRNNCYVQYLFYLRAVYTDGKNILKEWNKKFFLTSAFAWGETKEGMTFWRNVNEKWLDIVNKIE